MSNHELSVFTQWVKAITGVSFLVLGLLILKHGSKLETSITHSINLRSQIAKQLDGLDIRILSITIILSLVFLCRALIDCMLAWNLLHTDMNTPAVMIVVMFLCEVVISLIIVKIMQKREETVVSLAQEGNPNDRYQRQQTAEYVN